MKSRLEMGSNDVRSLGVWGMGGIGKTTLVEVVSAKLYSQFEGYCFLKNVREESQKYGLDAVRNKLFSALLEEENLRQDALCVETQSIRRRLLCKKLLIVLDDVATSKQMEHLMLDNNFLGQGSRVIVTTRDKQIIKHVHAIYEVNELNRSDSLELFCLNAFGEKHPKIGYEELSKSAISYCQGNPLALKVLGARLGSRSKMAWESDLKKLQSTSNGEIHNVLKLSYDDLEPTVKDIFLDIACFFKGWDISIVISVLEVCDFFPTIGMEVLLDKALITISRYSKYEVIQMHDLIKEMGRKIVNQESVKEPGERSRLWKGEEVADVLKNNKGTKAVEGIRLDTYELVEDLFLSSDSFKRMTNLRYLEINQDFGCKVYFPDGLEWLSDKLRYLQWEIFSLETLPSTFCAKMLVELHMKYSKLKKLWDGVQNLCNLKRIDISHSEYLIEMPDLSSAINLEIVNLEYCCSLCKLHPSVLPLPKLNELYLRGCTKIKSLKSNIHSKSLRVLDLKQCSSLEEFSVTSEAMTRLSLEGTAICELSSSIWHNSKLEVLELRGCKKLSIVGKKLSNDPGILGSVRSLDLSYCTQIDALNLSFLLDGIQSSLEELYLNGCCNLETIPHNIHKHSELKVLHLEDTAICELSSSIWHNSKLEDLQLMGCKKLSIVGKKLSNDPGISSLTKLNLKGCTQMDALNLSFLLDGIQSLVELYLTDCCNLETLPHNIHKHPELKVLVLDGCTKLVLSSPTEQLPPSLQKLRAYNCTTLIDTDSTKRLLLENMLQSILLKKYRTWEPYYLFMPGDQVPDTFGFQGGNSIVIPHLPKSNLKGFFFCVIFSKGEELSKQHILNCFIYEHGEQVGELYVDIRRSYDELVMVLISDHVLVCWYDYYYQLMRFRKDGGDHYNIEFKFQWENRDWGTDGIKGCGVLPVYGLELDDKSSNHRVEIVELEESTAQVCDVVDQFEARAIRDDDDQQQQPSYYPNEEDEENFNKKSSCDCSIGLLLKHLLGVSNRMFLKFFKHNKTTS